MVINHLGEECLREPNVNELAPAALDELLTHQSRSNHSNHNNHTVITHLREEQFRETKVSELASVSLDEEVGGLDVEVDEDGRAGVLHEGKG